MNDINNKKIQDLLAHSGELLFHAFNGDPVNVNPLTSIPEPQIKLYGFDGFFKGAFFDTEEELNEWVKTNNTNFGNMCTIEFLGDVANKHDVVRITYKNGDSKMVFPIDGDAYAVYNPYRSTYQGKFIWEYSEGELTEIYDALRERGIVFTNDIYGKIRERERRFAEMARSRGIFSPKKDN